MITLQRGGRFNFPYYLVSCFVAAMETPLFLKYVMHTCLMTVTKMILNNHRGAVTILCHRKTEIKFALGVIPQKWDKLCPERDLEFPGTHGIKRKQFWKKKKTPAWTVKREQSEQSWRISPCINTPLTTQTIFLICSVLTVIDRWHLCLFVCLPGGLLIRLT